MVVSLDYSGNEIAAGTPELVFEVPGYRTTENNYAKMGSYDIHPEEEKFVYILKAPDSKRGLVAVVNWFEELERLVPHPQVN